MKTGIARWALPLILVLTAGSQYAFAQRFICYPVHPGDTAARIALRLTGNARHRHQWWFRIVDPAGSRIVSKAEYGLILPGWQACIAEEILGTAPRRLNNRTTGSAHSQPLRRDVRENPAAETFNATSGFDFVWWVAAVLLTMPLAWRVAGNYFDERQAIGRSMKRFAEGFVREFERPLIQPHPGEHPIRARLRFAPHRDRLEILLAPAAGRNYPNLFDHRKNLEYDVERVLQVVGDRPFVNGRPYAQGRWVVIPFRFEGVLKEEGGK